MGQASWSRLRRGVTRLIAGVAMAVFPSVGRAGEPPPEAAPWEAHELSDLLARQRDSKRPWLEFLDRPSLSVGVYVLPERGDDRQQPHGRDEIYYVIAGRAVLEVEGERRPVREGSVLYVKAGIAHRFVDIETQLQVLVIFAGE